MGLEPMTNRVTDYYSSTELYFLLYKLLKFLKYFYEYFPLSDLNRYIKHDNGF